ncbi:hypothetical protein DWX45_06315 [Erysipelotrichaceae bacterium AF19-24AC]|nr:hypothetical protein DWX45_06315 [Erysipelotrichaceae bacterium AF19-24AC]
MIGMHVRSVCRTDSLYLFEVKLMNRLFPLSFYSFEIAFLLEKGSVFLIKMWYDIGRKGFLAIMLVKVNNLCHFAGACV